MNKLVDLFSERIVVGKNVTLVGQSARDNQQPTKAMDFGDRMAQEVLMNFNTVEEQLESVESFKTTMVKNWEGSIKNTQNDIEFLQKRAIEYANAIEKVLPCQNR